MSGLCSITLRTWGDADSTRYLHGRQKIPSFLCTKRCVQGVVEEEAGGMPLVVGGVQADCCQMAHSLLWRVVEMNKKYYTELCTVL